MDTLLATDDSPIGNTNEVMSYDHARQVLEQAMSALRSSVSAAATSPGTPPSTPFALADAIETVLAETDRRLSAEELAKAYSNIKFVRARADQDGLSIQLSGEILRCLAASMAIQFREQDARNYLEMHLNDPQSGESFAVSIQRVTGKTPHQLRTEAEAAMMNQAAEFVERTNLMQTALRQAILSKDGVAAFELELKKWQLDEWGRPKNPAASE